MTYNIETSTYPFKGQLISRSGHIIYGWACDLRYPDKVVSVDLIADGQWLGTARAELNLTCNDQSFPLCAKDHCFIFTLKQGQWQAFSRFEVWITNENHRLSGVIFSYQDQKSHKQILYNYVTVSGGLNLTGWLWNDLGTETDQKVIAYEAGQVVAEGVANLHSAELEAAGYPNTHFGFNLSLPLTMADGNRHEIIVATTDGKALEGSPVTVMVANPSLKNWVASLPLTSPDRTLLQAVMESYEWRVPVSTDLSFYSQWSARFATQIVHTGDSTPLLIAVTGSGNLQNTLTSLFEQTHTHWQALICTEEIQKKDHRIKFIKPSQWFKQLQKYLSAHEGLVSFIMTGDSLAPDALSALVAAFKNPDVQIVYTDCDYVCDDLQPILPWFKPDWDPDLFLASTPLHHLFATRIAHLNITYPDVSQPEAWPWIAVQSVGDAVGAIHHIPRVLYHRSEGALTPVNFEAQKRCDQVLAPNAIRELLTTGVQALRWLDPTAWPSVSLIVPTRDHEGLLKTCIESLLKTDYPTMEIIVVDNDSTDNDALAYLAQLKQKNIQVIKYPGPFNFSKINNYAVQQAKSSIIGLINNDIEVIEPDWLKGMVRHLLRPNVGAVGAKLLWPNGMVQHAGVILGMHGLAGHTGNDWYRDDNGYFGYNQTTHTVSAVTAACLLCKQDDYWAVGGLDENDFPVNFNDVDFCLKLSTLGKRIIWTPEAQLIHAESASRGADLTPERRGRLIREQNRLMIKWHKLISDDPYYNPNLNLDSYSYAGLAMPPRIRIL